MFTHNWSFDVRKCWQDYLCSWRIILDIITTPIYLRPTHAHFVPIILVSCWKHFHFWCSFFNHSIILFHTPCIIMVLHLHIIALHVSYTYSSPYITCFIHLTFYLSFTSSHCYITFYHDSRSSHSMLHQPCYKKLINCLCVLCFFVFFLQSYCFVLLCNLLLVCGDHCPHTRGLSPFVGSFFSLVFIIVALFLCLFCFCFFFLQSWCHCFLLFCSFHSMHVFIILLHEACPPFKSSFFLNSYLCDWNFFFVVFTCFAFSCFPTNLSPCFAL